MIEAPKFVPCMGLVQKLAAHARQRCERTAEVQPLIQFHVIERFSTGSRAPRVGRAPDDTGNSDRTHYPQRLSLFMSLKDDQKLAQPPANARLLHKPSGRLAELVPQGFLQRLPLACDCAAPVDILDNLLRRERDEYANDDDPDLAGELTPAMQRLGKMEMNAAGPPAVT